jgi:hypothetical protein
VQQGEPFPDELAARQIGGSLQASTDEAIAAG